MGWFSPVKGSYPSLAQVDKALPVKAGVKIQRGTIVALEADDTGKSADGVWDVASGTDEILYVALQDSTDPTAGFAGSAFDPDGGVPRINAIDLGQDGEYETSVFDPEKEYTVGQKLYVANGVLTTTAGTHPVGIVTAPKTDRWVNNAVAVPKDGDDQRLAIRTGATRTVIRFKTVG